MVSRLWTNLVILGSLAVLGGVVHYFYAEYHAASYRTELLIDLKEIAAEEGPCAALERTRSISGEVNLDLERAIEARRRSYAALVVGDEDPRAREALLGADGEGLVDRSLCEQIRLVRELGEVHPIVELLRYTRQSGDACEDPAGLDQALSALGSHRMLMLHALMEQVTELGCLPPWLSTKLGSMVIESLHTEPAEMDDLDHLRIAKFLEAWAPVQSAQLGCIAASGKITSRVAAAIGCTPYHLKQVLPRYRYNRAIPASAGAEEQPAKSEVLLLWEQGDRCEIRPLADPPRSIIVSCRELSLLSEIQVAVLIESITYGLAKASLIAGVASYDGASDKLSSTTKVPELRSWFGYSRNGEPLGMTQEVRLNDIADRFGEELPENPVRSYCHKVGARYCYDVDWTQLVGELAGEPIVFFSRPIRLMLLPARLPRDQEAALGMEAFGRAVAEDASRKIFRVGTEAYLLAEVQPGNVELRWRLAPGESWRSQTFGLSEGGAVPPSARLLAAMDLKRDGRPELLLQRVVRQADEDSFKQSSDEILLLILAKSGDRFLAMNRLTIHEY